MYSLIIIKNIYNIQIYPNSSISKIKELIFITKKFSHFKLETYHYTKKQKNKKYMISIPLSLLRCLSLSQKNSLISNSKLIII